MRKTTINQPEGQIKQQKKIFETQRTGTFYRIQKALTNQY